VIVHQTRFNGSCLQVTNITESEHKQIEVSEETEIMCRWNTELLDCSLLQ